MPLWLIVGIGSFIGGILRHLMSGWIQSGAIAFPIGTLEVNFIGSLILSLIMYISEYVGLLSEEARIFRVLGLLDRSPRCPHSVTNPSDCLNRMRVYYSG